MKSHLLVAAAILGAAVATPVESLAAERTMHPMTLEKPGCPSKACWHRSPAPPPGSTRNR